jgi:hypothetical protein
MGLPQAASSVAPEARHRRAVDFPVPPTLLEVLGDGDQAHGASVLRQLHAELAARKSAMPQATHILRLSPEGRVSVVTEISERRIA